MLVSSSANCTYLQNPSQFQYSPERHWREVSDNVESVGRGLQALFKANANDYATSADRQAPMPRKNFIDDYIFGRMERDGVQPAPLSTDQEFLRRVFLDLT